jgi:predicted RNA binding protein YcfA (HicA-like mRNA interferase family)
MSKSTHDKLMSQIITLAEHNGWEVSRTKRGHFRFVSPDKSQPVIHLSGTPSDRKTFICSVAQLRRHGLPIPR